MTDTIKKIWNSMYGNLIFFLLCVSIAGVYLYCDRPSVNNQNHLIEIDGTCKQISQELVYIKKIKKTEEDSTYNIYLNEYPCKFQVSYFPYDTKDFYQNTIAGDIIKLHIAKRDTKFLSQTESRIRSFSLTVNSKTYLSIENGLAGFGTGLFELTLIFLPLTIMTFLIRWTLKKK